MILRLSVIIAGAFLAQVFWLAEIVLVRGWRGVDRLRSSLPRRARPA